MKLSKSISVFPTVTVRERESDQKDHVTDSGKDEIFSFPSLFTTPPPQLYKLLSRVSVPLLELPLWQPLSVTSSYSFFAPLVSTSFWVCFLSLCRLDHDLSFFVSLCLFLRERGIHLMIACALPSWVSDPLSFFFYPASFPVSVVPLLPVLQYLITASCKMCDMMTACSHGFPREYFDEARGVK